MNETNIERAVGSLQGEVRAMHDTLKAMDARLTEQQQRHDDEDMRRFSEHDKRIASNERKLSRLSGMGALGAIVLSVSTAIGGYFVGGK